MDQKITKRLTRDTSYKVPEKTYQNSLTDVEISKKLEDYTRVKTSDIFKIPINTHVRYFSSNPKTGEKQFRLGGIITKFGDNNQYLVLSNGHLSWSVQLNNTTFYKKLTINEIKENVETETLAHIQKTKDVNIDELLKENKELKKMIKDIKETTLQCKSKKK